MAAWYHDEECVALRAFATRSDTIVVSSVTGLLRAMADERSRVVLVPQEFYRQIDARIVTAWLDRHPRRQLIVRVSASHDGAAVLARAYREGQRIQYSFRELEPLDRYLMEFGPDWPQTATDQLLAATLPHVPAEFHAMWEALVFVCDRPVSEELAAHAAGHDTAPTLRLRLAALRALRPALPGFPSVCGHLVAYHSHAACTLGDWTVPRLSTRAGYAESSGLNTYVWRHTETTLSGWLSIRDPFVSVL